MMVYSWRLLLFVLLSLSDLGLTWLLVGRGGGMIYESNPVAGWWLASYGWAGLAVFKALTVLAVIGLASVASHFRPRSGGLILTLACSALALVVGYSCYLVVGGARAGVDPAQADEIARLRAESDWIDGELQKSEDYRTVMERLKPELVDGRCTLAEATARLRATEKGQDHGWLDHLRNYFPASSDDTCLAASLIVHSLGSVSHDPKTAKRVARRLERELEESYGGLPGWDAHRFLAMSGALGSVPEAAPTESRMPFLSRNARGPRRSS